jgi:anthranilate synthase component 2
MNIIIIDNYDSFVYNIYQMIGVFAKNVVVKRNDQIRLDEIDAYDGIIISPGPGDPRLKIRSGIGIDVIKTYYKEKPILGICLGHQEIGYAFGAKVRKANRIIHGKKSLIEQFGSEIFKNLPKKFFVGRYHSLVIYDLTYELKIIAKSLDDGEIMGIEHVKYPTYGVQFHPESILTSKGSMILSNFLRICKK